MATNRHNYRVILFASLFTLVALVFQRAGAQTTSSSGTASDEQAIRDLVAQLNTGKMMPYTDNHIFVSGAYPRPIIGNEMNGQNKAAEERMKRERLNFHTTSNIQRLKIFKAGDMAYAFGTANLNWDTPEKKHVSLESSYLRVWRKLDNEWKVDVFFARPNEEAKIQ